MIYVACFGNGVKLIFVSSLSVGKPIHKNKTVNWAMILFRKQDSSLLYQWLKVACVFYNSLVIRGKSRLFSHLCLSINWKNKGLKAHFSWQKVYLCLVNFKAKEGWLTRCVLHWCINELVTQSFFISPLGTLWLWSLIYVCFVSMARLNGHGRGSMRKIWDVTNRSIVMMAVADAIVFLLLCCLTTSSSGLSIVPDILTYRTCVNSPPGFSPGCMDNVTVNPGGKATFNCQVLCT